MTSSGATTDKNQKLIIVAGATGNLGRRICEHLLNEGALVRALTRSRENEKVVDQRIELVNVDYANSTKLRGALTGAFSVISALSGLHDVIVKTQSQLLSASIDAGVLKFIPSDYCIDYRNLPTGQNRNLDIRREFAEQLSSSKIKATSVMNGMFTELLREEAPVILPKVKRIFFWGDADQQMDFTTIDNTAQFTALAALDDATPRWLLIAGQQASMTDLKNIASTISGKQYKFFRPGGLSAFKLVIKLTRMFAPGKEEIFPAWQGMQYLHDMLTGLPKFKSLDNSRYPRIVWTPIGEVIGRIPGF